jgi:site-specific recombinase XerD
MEMPGTTLIQSFERHLRAANRAPRTIGNYLETLHPGEAYLRRQGSGLERTTRQDLEAYLAHLLTTGRSGSTAATRYKWLRSFYRWLEDEEEVPSPMARMRAPTVSEQPVPVLGADALRRLFATCDGRSFEDRRDTALLTFLLDTGARRSELMSSGSMNSTST